LGLPIRRVSRLDRQPERGGKGRRRQWPGRASRAEKPVKADLKKVVKKK
jgi:hypothetical protein